MRRLTQDVNEEDFEIAYTEFTLWLTPCEPLRPMVRGIVGRLAADLDAVEFEPHVTLFCGPSTEAEAATIAGAIAAQFAPIELVADRLGSTGRYTKTLLAQFEESAIARRMFELARDCHFRRSNYVSAMSHSPGRSNGHASR